MEKDHTNNILALLPAYIEKAGSQNKAATLIGVSPATLTQMKQGNHANIADGMWNKVAEAVGYNPKNIEWQIYGTDNFEAIQRRCREAQEQFKFRAVAGFTGAGKTYATKYYAEHTPGAHYMRCSKSMNTKEFIKAVAQALGLNSEGTVYTLLEAIKKHIIKVANVLLIMDDAGKLNDNCMLLIQELYDNTEFRMGIIITGTDEELKEYIRKMAAKGKRGFKQLKSRIEDWQGMNTPKFTIVKGIAAIYGIIDELAITFIWNTCKDYRAMRNLILNASRLSTDKITLKELQLVSSRIGLKD